MKRLIIALALTALALAGWQSYRHYTGTYSAAEVGAAKAVVDEYYANLTAGQYSLALMAVAIPEEHRMDWQYERDWRSRHLKRLAETGEYRAIRIDGPELIGGPWETRPSRLPLTFYVNLQTESNGKSHVVGENLFVAQVKGRWQIVNFQSTDHYVRYRAFRFELQAITNKQ